MARHPYFFLKTSSCHFQKKISLFWTQTKGNFGWELIETNKTSSINLACLSFFFFFFSWCFFDHRLQSYFCYPGLKTMNHHNGSNKEGEKKIQKVVASLVQIFFSSLTIYPTASGLLLYIVSQVCLKKKRQGRRFFFSSSPDR